MLIAFIGRPNESAKQKEHHRRLLTSQSNNLLLLLPLFLSISWPARTLAQQQDGTRWPNIRLKHAREQPLAFVFRLGATERASLLVRLVWGAARSVAEHRRLTRTILQPDQQVRQQQQQQRPPRTMVISPCLESCLCPPACSLSGWLDGWPASRLAQTDHFSSLAGKLAGRPLVAPEARRQIVLARQQSSAPARLRTLL